MKTATAVLKYESIDNLTEGVTRVAEAEALAFAVCNEVHEGKAERHRIMAALGIAAHRLQEYRKLMTDFVASCKAEEEAEAAEQLPPVRADNVIPFPGRYRAAVKKNIGFARK